MKLLSLTADSGLLQALEAKGVTLSQLERLLPILDNIGALPLLARNKNLLLSLAPLLIEPAPLLLPLVVSLLKTPASSFTTSGAAFLTIGTYELIDQNTLLAVALLLVGIPLYGVGAILSTPISLPEVPSTVVAAAPKISVSSNRPVAKGKPKAAPVVAQPAPIVAAAAPIAAVVKAAPAAVKASPLIAAVAAKVSAPSAPKVTASGGALNGKRKTVKVNKA